MNVLVTGGGGFMGMALIKRLIREGHKVTSFSRREYPLHWALGISSIQADLRNYDEVEKACENRDVVFHLAALKHVPVCENNTWEAVLTNIHGTQNVIEAAINNGVKKVVDVSTDKAVEPFNLYGMTKACGEKLMVNANFNYDFDQKGMMNE